MNKSIFGSIRSHAPGKNAFDLSHEKKLSMQMGQLIPIVNQEVLPGDSFRMNSEIFMRLSPMIAPMMHRVNVFTHYFFVPNRIIWNEWESFITGGESGTEAPVHPQIEMDNSSKGGFGLKSLADYFGIPTMDQSVNYTGKQTISALPFRAYQEIYNEFYRDQNLEAKVEQGYGSGIIGNPERSACLTLRNRCWEKDYFTSCLPFAQRGGEVGIPVDWNYDIPVRMESALGAQGASGPLSLSVNGELEDSTNVKVNVQNLEENGVSVPITELRKAARLQEYLELMARGGSRYVEQLKSIFGVTSSDARLQRPEYLGGGKNPVVISETLSTVPTDLGNSPQGNMSGHGISVGKSNSFKRRFEEHGHIIGIMSVMPRTSYQQGLNRSWTRFDKFDHYIPQFAHIGEQEVLNKEIFQNIEDPTNEETFGYQSRYAEYKYKESSVHGDFRDTLNYWHMGRIFDSENESSPPVLNKDFVQSAPTQRVFAVTDPDENKLYVQIYNRVKAIRPMPYHNDPRL